MSFYPQPYKYQCGPFALKYALVMLGRFENEKKLLPKREVTGGTAPTKSDLQKLQKVLTAK